MLTLSLYMLKKLCVSDRIIIVISKGPPVVHAVDDTFLNEFAYATRVHRGHTKLICSKWKLSDI